MANTKINKVIGVSVLTSALMLAGCGGGEERQEAYLQKAQEYLEQENFDKAKIEARNVLQINPNNAEGRYILGMIAENDQNFRGAFGSFNAALEIDPNHIKSLNKVASYYFMSKDYDNAIKKVDEILALDAKNTDAMTTQAGIYATQNKTEEAITIAQEVLAIEPGNVQAVSILTSLYAKDSPELALEIISKGIANQTKNESLKMLKLRVLASQDKRDEVVAAYKELMAEYPENLMYPFQLVNYYLNDDRFAEEERKDVAESTLRALVEAKPEDVTPKLWLVEFLAKNRDGENAVKMLEQFVAEEPQNFQLRGSLANKYIQNKENDKAKALFKFVIDNDPRGTESIDARNQLIQIAFIEKDIEQVEVLLDEIFKIEPENAAALITRARLKLADNNIEAAIPDLRVVLKNDPESVVALNLLGRAHELNKSPDLALDSYQRLAAIKPDDLQALVGIGRILIAKNELENALSVLEQAQKVNPEHAEVVRLLSDLYTREQRWDDALSTAAKLTENEETLAVGYYLQGRIYLRKKDVKSAIPVLEKSLELEPRVIEALSALIGAYTALEQDEKAEAYLKAHIENNPEQLHAQELLGGFYARQGKMELANSLLREVIENTPERNSAYQLLARVLASQGKLEEIEELYQSGLKAAPKNSGLRLMLAEFYQARKNYKGAVDTYELLLKDNPDALLVKNNLASLLMDYFNTPENANRITELAADLGATEAPAFLDTAGWAQYQLGNYPQALSMLSAAMQNGGTGAVYHYHLGMAYFKNEMKAQAKEQLTLALADEAADFAGKGEAEATLKLLD